MDFASDPAPLRNLDFVSVLDPRSKLWEELEPGTFYVDGQDIYSGETICHAKLTATGHWYTCVAIIAAFLFIMSLKGLSEVKTARWGCIYGTIGMSLAIIGTWFGANVCNDGIWLMWVGIIPGGLVGGLAALKVTMIQMPQLVGLLNAFGGLASAICAIGLFVDPLARHGPNGASSPPSERVIQSVALYLAVIIGSITFWGSILACLKLMGTVSSKARILPARSFFNIIFCVAMIAVSIVADGVTDTDYHGVASVSKDDYLANAQFGFGTGGGIGMVLLLFVISALWGIQFVFAIGGADMPVVICVLNTGSGIAGVFAGFMLASRLLVITGTFVASSGVILSIIMCVAMNRSIGNVLIGGFGETSGAPKVEQVIEGEKKETNTEDFAEILNTSKTMIIVPGYGMAAGKAQHAVAALVRTLRDRGVSVKFAIHPVAGRLPGHMNVLLAEAQVPYDIVFAMDDINGDFEKTDVVLVLGANDIVNPSAAEDPTSPIAGMPVLEVWNAKKTFVVKRGGGTGYAGVENPLFFKENNFMYYGNAMKKMEEINAKIMTLDKVGGDDANTNGGGKLSVFEQIKVEVKETVPPCAEPKIIIGVLTENVDDYERRVALDPATCLKLTKLNYGILLHKGAGARSGYMDQQYLDSGCIIKESRQDVISGSHVINTVMPTTELLECSPLLKDKFVVCWIGKLTPDGKALVEKVAAAGINLIDVTSVPRITIAQKLDVLSSQAKIVGVRGTIEAAALYQRFFPLEMTAAGKYPQAQVMILGVGVAGLASIGQARALGAEVRAWDVRDVSDQVESMGGKWITVDFEEEGSGGGGYAKESSQAFQEAQKATFHRHAKECDIIITTAAIPGRKSPVLIEEYMVKDMKPGSVIIDLAAMGGGNCQLTRKNETYLYEGKVTICGALDFPSRMAMQASDMFGTNMYNLYQHIAVAGAGAKADAGDVIPTIERVMKKEMDEIVTSQVMCSYNGEVLNPGPPPMPTPVAPKQKVEPAAERKKSEIKKVSTMGDSFLTTSQFGSFLVFLVCVALAILVNDPTLIELVLVFMLAAWVGYLLVADVEPALHTPLMSVSNAISGQVILGGIVMVSSKTTGTAVLGVIACFVASINVFGGFVITLQMLDMFVTDKKSKVADK